jgi:hypothetical protein
MNEEVKKKTVSHSQFVIWWSCAYKWYRDYILHEKTFEDSIHMSFGTAIHEALQLYIKTLYTVGEKDAEALDIISTFVETFKQEVTKKGIKHTQEDFAEFVEDGKNIISEFKNPVNRLRYFPTDKWELIGVEININENILNNVVLNTKLDLVLKEKLSGDIRIIDFKTTTRDWTNTQKEDFTKTSQLLLYKAAYSKKFNIPLNKIHVEFIILRRKIYENCKYEDNRIKIFKPPSYQNDILQVIREFTKFVKHCFTPEGLHNLNQKYPKIPGENRKNCKYCNYRKNEKCDGMADPIENF